MSRFFFHVLDGKASIDHTGTELEDAAAAQREAVRTAGEMIRSRSISGHVWTMIVVSDDETVIMRLSFRSEANLSTSGS